jgi:hypothetical protein
VPALGCTAICSLELCKQLLAVEIKLFVVRKTVGSYEDLINIISCFKMRKNPEGWRRVVAPRQATGSGWLVALRTCAWPLAHVRRVRLVRASGSSRVWWPCPLVPASCSGLGILACPCCGDFFISFGESVNLNCGESSISEM